MSNLTALRTMAVGNGACHWKSSLRQLAERLRQQKQRWQPLASQAGTTNVSGGVLVLDTVCWKSSSLSSSSPLFSSTLRLLSTTSRTLSLSPRWYSNSCSSGKEMPSSEKCLSLDNINPNYVTMEYAVRGPVVIRAGEIEKELAQGVKKPFDRVIRANIGDCHAMGQKPITFVRQMLSLCYNTKLFDDPNIPDDIKKRAKIFLDGCAGGSAGSYTDSSGVEVVRRQVADYITQRDGHKSDYNNIILSGGASPAIKSILGLLNIRKGNKLPSVMTPIPQYPLYTATLAEYGMLPAGYYLDEDNNWSLDVCELERAIKEARKTSEPRGIVVINPGNPTGQVLTLENIKNIIEFAYKEKLVLLADEVYQHNIYDPNSKFHSFKKVMMDMGAPYNQMELVSFNSTSKGFFGECGIRGGYMEVINFCPQVYAMLVKSITASLCSTTAGQIAVSSLVYPPKQGEPSYELYMTERNAVLNELAKRAAIVYETFNTFEGFKCNKVQGAMYAFPQITIPPKAIEEAKKQNLKADVFYAFELLNTAGVCVVAGTGFMQKPGTYHFRTTILPPTDLLKEMLNRFKEFHATFMAKYK